jgi:isopentenyldiphosphate isomerase
VNRVVIVDADDQETGLRPYDGIRYEDIYRVTALWLSDTTSGDCLITQRKWTKHNDPGKWMAAASGTVEEGEDYDQNIVQEIKEEIGLRSLELTKGPKEFIDDGEHKFFVQWYRAEVDKGDTVITLQEDEVEAYDWIAQKTLVEDVLKHPEKYVPSMQSSMEKLGLL